MRDEEDHGRFIVLVGVGGLPVVGAVDVFGGEVGGEIEEGQEERALDVDQVVGVLEDEVVAPGK